MATSSTVEETHGHGSQLDTPQFLYFHYSGQGGDEREEEEEGEAGREKQEKRGDSSSFPVLPSGPSQSERAGLSQGQGPDT